MRMRVHRYTMSKQLGCAVYRCHTLAVGKALCAYKNGEMDACGPTVELFEAGPVSFEEILLPRRNGIQLNDRWTTWYSGAR